MLDLSLLGGWAAEGAAAGPLTSPNPVAGVPAANAADTSALADVFHSLVAAMAGTGVQPATAVAPDAAPGIAPDAVTPEQATPEVFAHKPGRFIDADQIPATQRDDDDNANGDAPIAVMLVAPVKEPAVAALVAANVSTAAPPTKSDPTTETAVARKDSRTSVAAAVAVHPERHVVPIERIHHADLGADTPSEPETPQPAVSKRIEFARAFQAGVEIAASTAHDLNPPSEVAPELSVRTALPTFTLTAVLPAAAPRARAAAPAVMGAPTPPTPMPLTVVPPAMRDITAMAFRLSAPGMPVLSAPVEDIAPQIVQTLRVAWSRGVGEAQIRLDPRQFGDVSVSLRVEAGQVVARVQADAPAVREWLQSNQRTLQAGLAEHQLRLGRLEVVAPGDETRDGADANGRRREESADDQPARRPRRRESTGSFEVVA